MKTSPVLQSKWQPQEEYGRVKALLSEFPMAYREMLGALLRERSLIRGEIVLSSGQKSNYYLDCKLTTLDPYGAFLTGHAMLEMLDEMRVKPSAIGGLSMGADPIVAATTVVSYLKGCPLPGFLIRKERKQHGRQKQIEGIDASVREVAIVDEVCTTGASTQEAIDIAEREGYKVIAVLSLVDREEGGSVSLRSKYNYRAVFTASELMEDNERSAGAARDTAQPAHSGTPIHH